MIVESSTPVINKPITQPATNLHTPNLRYVWPQLVLASTVPEGRWNEGKTKVKGCGILMRFIV
jgi:hypothetical protein